MKIKIKPTRGERFRAQRRRDGLTRTECAAKLKIDAATIRYWEESTPGTPNVKIELTKGEMYLAIRERLGLKLKAAALLMEISHVTLIKIEKGDEDQKVLNVFYSEYIAKNNIKL